MSRFISAAPILVLPVVHPVVTPAAQSSAGPCRGFALGTIHFRNKPHRESSTTWICVLLGWISSL
eukprot:6904892-Prorocentrum_lima.AAC.1